MTNETIIELETKTKKINPESTVAEIARKVIETISEIGIKDYLEIKQTSKKRHENAQKLE